MTGSPPPAPETPAGVFVPWDPTRADKRAAKMGWITNERGCDIWQGSRAGGRYAKVRVDGRTCQVHRLRYEREIGPIPSGEDLDHFVCDNGAGGCCNPFHCRPASGRENTLRGNTITAACAAKTHCPRGHLLAGENLEKWSAKTGHRRCRICRNALYQARYHAKRRTAHV